MATAVYVYWLCASNPILTRGMELAHKYVYLYRERIVIYVDTPWIQQQVVFHFFLATYAMSKILLDTHDAYDRTRNAACQNKDRSLHHAALEYLILNNDAPRYEDLVEQLGRIDRGEGLRCGSQSLVKTGIKLLYGDFLQDFRYFFYTGKRFCSCICICSAEVYNTFWP